MDINIESKFETSQKTYDLWFLVTYIIWLSASLVATTLYYKYYVAYYAKFSVLCVLFLFCGEFLHGSYKPKDIISAFTFFLVALFLVRFETFDIHMLLFFVFFSRNVKFEKIAKASELVSLLTLLFVIVSSYMGIVQNYIFDQGTPLQRECLGFRYPLFPAYILCNAFAMALCADKQAIKWKKILLYFVLNIWMYKKTYADMSFIVIMGCIAYAIYIKLKLTPLGGHAILYRIMIMSFVILFAVSIYTSINYDPGVRLYSEINALLSSRWRLQKAAVDNYGITLFGNNIHLNGWGLDLNGETLSYRLMRKYNYIDNAYIQLLILRGLIYTVLVVALFTYTSYRAYKDKRYVLVFVLATLAVRFFIDDLGLQLYYNTLWMAVSPYIFSSVCTTEEELEAT